MNMKLSDLAKEILEEDQVKNDITTSKLASLAQKKAEFNIVTREPAVFSGLSWVEAVATQSDIQFSSLPTEGEHFDSGSILIFGSGYVSELLAVERSLLNVLQQTCGVATFTASIVEKVQKAAREKGISSESIPKIFHTRKTLPLLRDLQIDAVLAGGANLHRRDLASRMLFKDNHKRLIEESGQSYADFLGEHLSFSEMQEALVEVDSLAEALSLKDLGVKNILLDNFSPEQVQEAVTKLPGVNLEVSGGVNAQSIGQYVIPGVARISLGCLTHSVRALDLSLDIC